MAKIIVYIEDSEKTKIEISRVPCVDELIRIRGEVMTVDAVLHVNPLGGNGFDAAICVAPATRWSKLEQVDAFSEGCDEF